MVDYEREVSKSSIDSTSETGFNGNFKEIGRMPGSAVVSLRTVIGQYHEQNFLTSIEPDNLPNPQQLYLAEAPLFCFLAATWGNKIRIRGSLARHAAYLAIEHLSSSEPENSRRYQLNNILRWRVFPELNDDFDNLKVNSPLIAKGILDILPGPDMADLRIEGVDAHSESANRFFGNLPAVLLHYSNRLANYHHQNWPGVFAEEMRNLAKKGRKQENLVKPEADKRIEIYDDERFLYAARLPLSVHLGPIEKIDRELLWLGSEPRTRILWDIPDLVVLGREFNVKDEAFRVAEITLGADLTPQTPKLERIYPISTTHIIFENSKKHINSDTRLGPKATTHEVASRLRTTKYVFLPPFSMAKILDLQNVASHYDKIPAGVWLQVSKKDIKRLNKPVDLREDWVNFNPNSPQETAIALEVLSRSFYQAIDSEIQFPDSKEYLATEIRSKSTKLQRISDKILTQITDSDLIGEFRKNILLCIIANPHRTTEYLGLTGIWDKLRQKHTNLPDLQTVLERINSKIKEKDYVRMIRGDRRGRMTHEQSEDFVNGWKLIDEAAGLSGIFDSDNYVERVWQLSGLN